jgi:hypothetical protein
MSNSNNSGVPGVIVGLANLKFIWGVWALIYTANKRNAKGK